MSSLWSSSPAGIVVVVVGTFIIFYGFGYGYDTAPAGSFSVGASR
jgi:hypothetical protein